MTSNKSTYDKRIQNLGTAPPAREKERRRTIDKAKVEENKEESESQKKSVSGSR